MIIAMGCGGGSSDSTMLIFLLIILLGVCHARTTDPLIRWLDQLRIDIPDQSYENGLLRLHVQDLHCTHFTITSMESTVASIGVHGVGASCQGRYGASGMTGALEAKLGSARSEAPDFKWGYNVSNAPNATIPIPDALETVSCETHVAVTDLHFHGSWSAKLIDLFRTAIEKGINDAVSSKTICPQVKAHVDPLVTDLIRRGVAYLQQYLPVAQYGTTLDTQESSATNQWRSKRRLDGMNTAAASTADSIVFERDLPVLPDVLSATNTFVGTHLNQGLWPNASICHGGFAHGFNGILHDMLPSIHMQAPLQFQMEHLFHDATVTIRLEDWTIAGHGLHQWEAFKILVPKDEASFSSHIKTNDLDISVKTSITVDIPSSEPLFESFEVSLSLSSIDVATDVLVELDRLVFQNVTAGDVLTALHHFGTWTPAVACLVHPVTRLSLESLATSATVSSLQLHAENAKDNSLEEDVDVLINHVVAFVLDQYEALVSEAIVGVSRGPIQTDVNSFLATQIHDVSKNCIHSDAPSDGDAWIDFTQIELLEQLNSYLHNPETIQHLNDYIECTTSIVGKAAVEKLSGLSSLVKFDDIQLEHFGSLQALYLLLPTNVTTLESAFSIGEASEQPQVTAHAHVPAFDGEVFVSISLSNLTGASIATILYDQSVLGMTPLAELLSKGQCLLAPTQAFDLTYFDGSFGRLHVNSTAHVRLHNTTYAVNFVSDDFPEIQDFAWTIFEWSISTIHKALTSIADTTVNSAYRTCDPSSKPTGENNTSKDDPKLSAHSLWVILGTLFILAQPMILLFRHGDRKIEEVPPSSTLSEPLLRESSSRSHDDPPSVQERATSLMQSFNAHTVHYVLPVTILLTVVLFLASNSSIGATVDLSLTLPGQSLDLPNVYQFGLIDTAKNMLNAGIYPLFLLVVVFSGIWPYAKLVLMFASWVAPENILSVKRRENLLRTLDSCSKYSLVDTYVFIVMLVAFRYHVESDEVEHFAFDVYVAPRFGFYGFLLATTLSLVIGHVMVYYHRCEALRGTLNAWSSEATSSLITHKYILPDGRRCSLSPASVFFMMLCFVVTVALLTIGIDQRSFSFSFGGVAGFLLGEERSHVAYSVITLWKAIPESVDGAGIAATLLQAAFFFYTVATPFLCLLLLSLLTVCPLSVPGQIQLLSVAEIANSWSALEVFVLSILAALFEISTFSSFIVGDKCYLINEITSTYTELADPSCFNVKCLVTWDSLYLIVGTLLLSIWSSFVLRLTRLSIMERISAENSMPSEGQSFIAILAERFPWIFVEECDQVEGTEDLPVISDDRIASRWTDSGSNSGVWDETTREDPSWKDWKDTTNVT